jgi:serine/threonine protein kinase
MPKLSDTRKVLRVMTRSQLREFCDHHEVPRTRASLDMVRGLVGRLGTNLESLVNASGPWSRDQWNDLSGQLGGTRRRSFEDVVQELRGLLGDQSDSDVSESRDVRNAGPSRPSTTRIVHARYEVLEVLGEGGFGIALLVKDRRLPKLRPHVLKVAHDPETAAILENEIERALRLSHPNICVYRTYDVCPDSGPYVVMEYAGTSVEKSWNGRAHEAEWVIRVGREIARALDYIHGEGMMHGDVSPGNILIDQEGRVRLTDFGIASGVRSVTQAGGHRTRLGTTLRGVHPKYSAPEVAGGGPRPSSDQWSLALVMLELLRGRQDRTAMLDELPRLPRAWRTPFERALSVSPAQRYSNCTEFVAALPNRT